MHFFSVQRCKHMNKVMDQLQHVRKDKETKIPQHDNLIEAVRKGVIEEDTFDKLGPTMVLQWVIRMEDLASVRQDETDAAKQIQEACLDKKQAEQALVAARVLQACIDAGEKVDMADEEVFDPFPDEIHPSLSKVK
jgi:hypothetical protein